MFQAGEVDYMVATDAIGMGLNMDLDHVAFAKTVKFDGRAPRRLSAAEIAQIAGRAGRHMSDGTFGVTADERPLAPELVEAIEDHRFDPLTRLYWRNARLDFALGRRRCCKSLDARPRLPGLVATREADDHRALAALARDAEIAALAPTPRRGAAALGSVPDPRFPQGHVGTACALARPDLPPSARAERQAAGRLGGGAGRAGSTAPTATSTR